MRRISERGMIANLLTRARTFFRLADVPESHVAGAAFLESGEILGASGAGYWQQLPGVHKWQVRRIVTASNGAVMLSEGTLDLATRSFTGTIRQWTY
jgi:hypothetical protein